MLDAATGMVNVSCPHTMYSVPITFIKYISGIAKVFQPGFCKLTISIVDVHATPSTTAYATDMHLRIESHDQNTGRVRVTCVFVPFVSCYRLFYDRFDERARVVGKLVEAIYEEQEDTQCK